MEIQIKTTRMETAHTVQTIVRRISLQSMFCFAVSEIFFLQLSKLFEINRGIRTFKFINLILDKKPR